METKQFQGFSANMLKGIAMATMLVDHFAYLVVPDRGLLYTVLHFIGSCTAPILFYFVAEGYHYTHSANKYIVRLVLFAAVSYLPFIWYFDAQLPSATTFLNLNVIYTILLGFLALRVKNELHNPVLKVVFLAVIFVLGAFGDWGYIGILMILAFDHFYGDFKSQKFAYLLILLCDFIPMVLSPLWNLYYGETPDFSFYWIAAARAGGFVPIFLLQHYNGQIGRGGKLAKWSFYLFYPLHLLLLSALRTFL